MPPSTLVHGAQQALLLVVAVSLPVLGVAALVGFVVAALQAASQIQESDAVPPAAAGRRDGGARPAGPVDGARSRGIRDADVRAGGRADAAVGPMSASSSSAAGRRRGRDAHPNAGRKRRGAATSASVSSTRRSSVFAKKRLPRHARQRGRQGRGRRRRDDLPLLQVEGRAARLALRGPRRAAPRVHARRSCPSSPTARAAAARHRAAARPARGGARSGRGRSPSSCGSRRS